MNKNRKLFSEQENLECNSEGKGGELKPAIAFRPQKAELKLAVGFRHKEDFEPGTGRVRDGIESTLYANPDLEIPVYWDETEPQMDFTVPENPLDNVVHALVTECGLLIDDITNNKPEEGLKRAVIIWKRIEDLSDDYRKEVEAAILDGNIEFEKIRDHKEFYNAFKDAVDRRKETEIINLQNIVESEFEPYVAGYVKQGGWICTYSEDENKGCSKLFRCDIECLAIEDMYDAKEELICRHLILKVKTVQDEKKFPVDLTWDGKTIEKLFRKVLGFVVHSGVQFEREMKNLLSELATQAPITKILKEQGWQRIHGKMRYVYDGRKDIAGYKADCKKYILQNEMYGTVDIWSQALKVFNQPRVAGPVLCYALYGVTYRLFADAHQRPTGILFVAGETGAMKTSLSKVFFFQFCTDEDAPVFSFQSTKASIDPFIRDAKDTLLVIDDYCPNSTMTSDGRKDMQKLLDYLIRIYGDATARRKSTANSELIEAPRASGGAVATGEIEAEGRSSCLRLITTELRRGDIDGKALQLFQDNRDMWSTFMARYILYLEDHYDQIVQMIHDTYPKLRDKAKMWLSELRNVDHYVECTIINHILCGFLQAAGMTLETAEKVFELLDDGLKYHIKRSETLAKEQNPAQLMLEAVVSVLTNGMIKIAESVDIYANDGTYYGYISEDGLYYVEETALKAAVEKQIKSEYGYVGYERKSLLKVLHGQFDIIKKFKNGGENYKFTTKIKKLRNKVQVVVVDLKKAEVILNE